MINSEIRQQLNESPLIGTSVTNKDVAAHLDNLFGETGWSYTFTQLARTIICSLLIKTVQRHVIVPEEDHDKALLLATEMFGLRTKEAEPQVEKPKVEKKAKEKAEPAPAVEQKPEPVNVETDDDALADEIFGKAEQKVPGHLKATHQQSQLRDLSKSLGRSFHLLSRAISRVCILVRNAGRSSLLTMQKLV